MLYRGARHFNPRSLTGATRRQEQAVTFMSISIHAPSRERLPPLYPPQDCSLISIHAPSRERHISYASGKAEAFISIHAPSRERHLCMLQAGWCNHFNPRSLTGATGQTGPRSAEHSNFNPRSLTGATTYGVSRFRLERFQSTLPHGSDRVSSGTGRDRI